MCFLLPKSLNLFEKQRRNVEVAKEILSITDDDLKCIVTGDETWTYLEDPEKYQ